MSYVKEKVSYLRGLFEGLGLKDDDSKKLISAIIDTLDSMASAIDDNKAEIEEMDNSISDIYDYLDDIDEDLLYNLDLDDDDDFENDDFIEVQCPHCDDIVYFDHDMLTAKKDLICPACNESIILTITED